MSLSSPLFLNVGNYTWNKALLWGHSIGHFRKCQKGSLGERTIHLIVAVTEALPIIGQIVSIFETAVYKFLFYRLQKEAKILITAIKATDEGIDRYHQKEFEKAIEFFLCSLKNRENIYGENDPHIVNSLADLGNAYYQQGQKEAPNHPGHIEGYTKAFECFSRALEISEEDDLDPKTRDGRKDFSRGLDSFIIALKIRGNAYGEEDPRVLNSLHVLAESYFSGNNSDSKAIECFKKILEIKEKVYGEASADVASALVPLAKAYQNQDNTKKAIEIFSRALEIMEHIHGKENPQILSSLSYLGNAYYQQKNFSEAIKFFTRALEIKELVCLEEGPQMLGNLSYLGNAYYQQEDFPKAIEAFNRALGIQENSYGEESLWIVDQLVALGDAFNEQGVFSKAVECFKRALDISESSYRKGDSEELAILYQRDGGVEKAIELFRRRLEAAKSSLESIPVDREQ